MSGQDLDHERLQQGHRIRRNRRPNYVLDDAHILQCQDNFDVGRYQFTLKKILATANIYS